QGVGKGDQRKRQRQGKEEPPHAGVVAPGRWPGLVRWVLRGRCLHAGCTPWHTLLPAAQRVLPAVRMKRRGRHGRKAWGGRGPLGPRGGAGPCGPDPRYAVGG